MPLDPSLTTSLLGQGHPLVSTASWGLPASQYSQALQVLCFSAPKPFSYVLL